MVEALPESLSLVRACEEMHERHLSEPATSGSSQRKQHTAKPIMFIEDLGRLTGGAAARLTSTLPVCDAQAPESFLAAGVDQQTEQGGRYCGQYEEHDIDPPLLPLGGVIRVEIRVVAHPIAVGVLCLGGIQRESIAVVADAIPVGVYPLS